MSEVQTSSAVIPASSSTATAEATAPEKPTSIVGEIVYGLYKVETAVEHLIHPDAEGSASAPGESLPGSTGTSAAPGASAASSDANASASPSVPAASTQPPSDESGNVAASSAVAASANDTSSSASLASPDIVTAATPVARDPAHGVLVKIVGVLRSKFGGLSSELNSLLDEAEKVI